MLNARRVVVIAGLVLSCSLSRVCAAFGSDSGGIAELDEPGSGSSFDDSSPSRQSSHDRWQFSLSGGESIVNKINTGMQTQPANVQLTLNNSLFLLNFPARNFAVTDMGRGIAVQTELTRQLLPWFGLGLHGGISFNHGETVETGQIPFLTFDSLGNLISLQTVNYEIKYSVVMYDITPMVTLGSWIPAGRYAWRPYISGGAGFDQVNESIVFRTQGTNFQLGWRNTNYLGLVGGGGLDFRISPSGSIGAEYQVHQVRKSGQTMTWSTPTIRLSYLF